MGAMLGLGLALATTASAAEAGTGGRRLTQLQAELGLSEDQVNAIRQLHQGQGQRRREVHQDLYEARKSLRELILDGTDQAAIQAKIAEVQQLTARGIEMRAEMLKGLAQILTPEQREKFAQLQLHPRRHGMMRSRV